MTTEELREVARLHRRIAKAIRREVAAREDYGTMCARMQEVRAELRAAIAEADKYARLLDSAQAELRQYAVDLQDSRQAHEAAEARVAELDQKMTELRGLLGLVTSERADWKRVAGEGTEEVVRLAARVAELEAQLAAGGAK